MSAVLKEFSRNLRKNPTEAEKKLWRHLRQKQLDNMRFRRQCPIDGAIADFVCFEKRIIIELGGGQHFGSETQDLTRTQKLESKGFLVLRFWNNDVLENVQGVLQTIINNVNPHPDLPSQGEGNIGDI